ncbi:hypothetical protein [Tatumella sp. JGM118]|uniref:Uncharacterized protein n=1 Tax=Tatumella terrea TaxID=419007 RepID=A0ABW1VX83_9GAMM|nr:hypothetical protein [Tatumella sp. JGM118]MBS0910223.1 hypothetical protein [Tatumella sp. JGM118]
MKLITRLPGILCALLLLTGAFPSGSEAAQSKDGQKRQAIIFLNTQQGKEHRLAREINRQLYYSRTLSRQLEVTLIDIAPDGPALSGAARYLRDTSGIWVAKYRPLSLPALFCQQGKSRRFYHLTTAEDIRKCL